MRKELFGIPLEGLDLATIQKSLLSREPADGPFWIVTTNAEILLEAHRDATYANVLKQADLRIVDGSGPEWMLRLRGHRVTRVTGGALTEELLKLAQEKSWKVGLIGAGEGIAEKAKRNIEKRFPNLVISAERGGRVDRAGMDDATGEEARQRLTLFAPDVLLVAFGHPKQEQWILRYMRDFPTLKVVVGVGGVLNVLAGAVKPAPQLMHALGLEWLWRLILEPRRIGRIVRAVVIFPMSVLWSWI